MAGFVAHCGGLVARAVAQNGAQQARGYSHAVARRSSRVMYARGLRMSAERNSDAAVMEAVAPTVAPADWRIKLLYDSECSLCMKEVNFLQRRDVNNKIYFVDIASDDYSPQDKSGLSYETAMRRIHGIERDGNVIVGVPVFRAVYEEIGLGWVYAITKVPFVGFLAGKLYDVWADYRLRITGRKELAELIKEREVRLAEVSCEDTCDVPN